MHGLIRKHREAMRHLRATCTSLDDFAHRCYSDVAPWIVSTSLPYKDVLDEAQRFFQCATHDLFFVGSAHFGFSTLTGRPFRQGLSDLDLAIVNEQRFLSLQSTADEGNSYWAAGICRPDKVSNFLGKAEWLSVTEALSTHHRNYFSSISFTLYRDADTFFAKQSAALHSYYVGQGFKPGVVTQSTTGSIPLLEQAASRGFPLHILPISQSRPENSSPYVMAVSEVAARFSFNPRRRALINSLEGFVSNASKHVTPRAMMLGGSFINTATPSPSDIDLVLFYSIRNEFQSQNVSALNQVLQQARAEGIDARLAPLDADPIVLLQMASFFTGLYSCSRSEADARKGVILVPLNERRNLATNANEQ